MPYALLPVLVVGLPSKHLSNLLLKIAPLWKLMVWLLMKNLIGIPWHFIHLPKGNGITMSIG